MRLLGPKSTIASLDIDAQCGFTDLCPQELPVPEGTQIVTELNHQARLAQYRIGSKDAHSPNAYWVSTPLTSGSPPGEHMDAYWPAHCVPGTLGFQALAGLPHPSTYDFFVWKGIEPDMHPYGACYHDLKERLSTGLIEFLTCKAIDTVLVGGLATDFCVKSTVLQLRRNGFQVFLNLGACRGLAPHTTQKAIALMKEQGTHIISSYKTLLSHEP